MTMSDSDFPNDPCAGSDPCRQAVAELYTYVDGELDDVAIVQRPHVRHTGGRELVETGAVYDPPQATYLAWLDCSALGLGPDPATTFLERGVALSAGPEFGPQGEGHVRLNFATAPAILAAIVATMAG